jgi:signal transduction histidine kinase
MNGLAQILRKAASRLGPRWAAGSSLRQTAQTVRRLLHLPLSFSRFRTEDRERSFLTEEEARLAPAAIDLANAAETAAAEERLRLAALIHHRLAHHQATALIQLQLCQRHIPADAVQAQEFLHNTITSAQIVMDSIRATIYALQYPTEQGPRIATLLDATAGRLRSVTTADIDVDVDDVGALSPAIESGISSIACEALANAVKHAAAHHIHVRLYKNQDQIIFEVSDDGKGFDHEEIFSRANHWGGFGLKLMREQARQLNGTLQIQRLTSGGTLVRAILCSSLRHPTPPHGRRRTAGAHNRKTRNP